MPRRHRNVSPYAVEVKVIFDNGYVTKSEIKTIDCPPTCKDIKQAESFALGLLKRNYPDAELKVVSITDHFILADFFPAF